MDGQVNGDRIRWNEMVGPIVYERGRIRVVINDKDVIDPLARGLPITRSKGGLWESG
jgi:hypothetical protein